MRAFLLAEWVGLRSMHSLVVVLVVWVKHIAQGNGT